MSDLMAIAAAGLPAAMEAGETELAKGLAGLLGQVYGDTLSPSAKQIGVLIEDAVKTVRLLAWPLQMGSVLQDRFRNDLTTAMERVAPPDRQIPSLKLFADCCEGSKFEDDPALREMWQQLLSRGCDKTRAGDAHPSYPLLIQQLSGDEATLLNRAYERGAEGILPVMAEYKLLDHRHTEPLAVDGGWPQLRYLDQILFYVSRLTRLGLIEKVEQGEQQALGDKAWMPMEHYRVREVHILTAEGNAFMAAVSSSPAVQQH